MRNSAFKIFALCGVLTGQLMAAHSALALEEGIIQTKMKNQLQSYLGDKGRVDEISVSRGTSRSFAPCEDVDVEMIMPVRNLHRPSYYVECESSNKKRRARGIAKGSIDIVRAKRSLSRGRMLMGTDIELQRIDLSEFRSGMLFDKQHAYGRALRTPIRRGRALTNSLLDKKYDILTGQSADLSISRQGIFFSIPVKALESGRVGDTIPVQNESSGKVFQVTIGKNGQLKL